MAPPLVSPPTLPTESTSSPNPEAEVPPSLGQLREFMLGLINDDRAANGLTPVLLGNNPAAQAHAEEMLEQGYLSHWGMDGLKPYMRYTLAGGFNYEGENASAPASPAVEGANYRRQSAIRSLEETQQGLMDSPGHRSNILDKWHKKVNLGIACSPITCAVSQQFEGDYIEFTETPAISKGVLRFTGGLKAPFIFDGVQIWYDQPPKSLTVGQLSFTYSYGIGQQPATFLSKPLSGGAYYPTDTSNYSWESFLDPYSLEPDIPAKRTPSLQTIFLTKSEIVPWTIASLWKVEGRSFQIEANISSIVNALGPGVYTVVIWGKAGSESVALTRYSIFVE